MAVQVSNHLNFRGDARAALAFYQSVFGGDLVVVTYTDAHNVQDPAEADQIMWGQGLRPERVPRDGVRRAVADAVGAGEKCVLRLGAWRLG